MTRRRLPIGIQTFRKIREESCYYVDKTTYIRNLLDTGTHYFLSRPRRFGKSLFLDTLKELFEGNEPLFEGLGIHGAWDWSVRHPVVRLSFGSGNFKEPGQVKASLMAQLDAVQRRTGVVSEYATAPERFAHLLEALHDQAGQRVAVLVDEYDKPILDALDTAEVARANRDFLRGLYAVLKDSDAHIRFSFPDRGEQVLQGQPVLGTQQPHRHHPGPPLLGHMRLHRGGPGPGVRTGASGSGPRRGSRLVQRILVAGRGEGLQPLRHPAAARQAQVRPLVVRDRHPGVSAGDAARAPSELCGPRRDGRQRRPAVRFRRGRHRDRGVAVPDGLSHHRG